MGRAHLTDICSLVLRPNSGKHLTNSLVLHFFAAAQTKVESISQALCSCTSMCLSHLRITATFFVECPLITFILKLVSENWIFGCRSVIVRVFVRVHGQETESARVNALKRNLSLLCMAGSTWLQASQEWFPQWRFRWECKKSTPCRTLCKMSIRTALHGEILVIALCEGSAKWYQQGYILRKMCWLSVYPGGQ